MKYKDFINETPALVDIQNDPDLAERQYKYDLSKNKPVDEYDWDDYNVVEFKGKHSVNNIYIIKDGKLQMYIAYTVENIKNIGKMVQNSYIQKAAGATIPTSSLINFISYMVDNKGTTGIISDDIQSVGGKKLWRAILQNAVDKNKEVGVYNNFDETVHPKDEDQKFALWYAIRSREVYGKDLEKAQYQLYMKK